MSNQGIHGNLLEVTVVSCNKLKDVEWISRQDPYVSIEYGSNRFTTRACKDGGKNPTFQEKFMYTLIEGLRELNLTVWNSNTLTHDDYIGSGKIPLTKVLSQGFDDSSWPLQCKIGRHAGEVRLIMHYSDTNKPTKDYVQKPSEGYAPPAQYVAHPTSMYYVSPPTAMYSTPPTAMYSTPPPPTAMYSTPPPPTAMYSTPPPPTTFYPPPSTYPSYPPDPNVYPPAPYPPPSTIHPPPPYPPNSAYGLPYPPSSPFPGMYPPPPY